MWGLEKSIVRVKSGLVGVKFLNQRTWTCSLVTNLIILGKSLKFLVFFTPIFKLEMIQNTKP